MDITLERQTKSQLLEQMKTLIHPVQVEGAFLQHTDVLSMGGLSGKPLTLLPTKKECLHHESLLLLALPTITLLRGRAYFYPPTTKER